MSGNIYEQDVWLGNESKVRALEQRIHEYVNQQRQNHNCYEYDSAITDFSKTASNHRAAQVTLDHDSTLRRIARQHSIYLCNNPELLYGKDIPEGAPHYGPNGEEPKDKVGTQITILSGSLITENIAYRGGSNNDGLDIESIAQKTVTGDSAESPRGGWLYSTAGHKENMLACDHIKHGIGVAITENCIVATDILTGPY